MVDKVSYTLCRFMLYHFANSVLDEWGCLDVCTRRLRCLSISNIRLHSIWRHRWVQYVTRHPDLLKLQTWRIRYFLQAVSSLQSICLDARQLTTLTSMCAIVLIIFGHSSSTNSSRHLLYLLVAAQLRSTAIALELSQMETCLEIDAPTYLLVFVKLNVWLAWR